MKTIEIIDSGQDKYTEAVDIPNKYTYVESEEDVLEENIEN